MKMRSLAELRDTRDRSDWTGDEKNAWPMMLLAEQADVIDFDVETTGLQAYGEGNEAFLWIFGDADGLTEAIPYRPSGDALPSWGITDENKDEIYAKNFERIRWWFRRARKKGIRAWNAKFDRAFADTAGVFADVVPGDGLWHDGMLVAHAMDERRSVALKSVASSLFPGADDPQKLLKGWLTAENNRRAKLLKDAEKAEVGTLKVDNELYGQAYEKGDLLPDGTKAARKGKYTKQRLATSEERAEVIAAAKAISAGNQGYVRANYSHVPREIMEPYAEEDVILTRKVVNHYMVALANEPDLLEVIEFERATMDALYALEARGLPVKDNGVEYRKLEQEVIRNLEPLHARCMELAAEGDPFVYAKHLAAGNWGKGKKYVEKHEDGTISYYGGAAHLSDFNPGSSHHVHAALLARDADLSFMTQKDGKLPMDADNLRAVDDELAVAILNFRAEAKVLSTYVQPMIDKSYVSSMNVYKEPFIAPDSRVHANYRQVGTITGRMSCSDPNMQNQPRDDLRLRYNIVAPPGYKLVTCDLTNVEMYLFAAYCGNGRLLDAVQKGEDLHTLTAKMLGLRDRARPGGGVEKARQQGKTYNFSRIYGGGLRTIRRSLRCDLNTAKLYKQRFDNAYPEAVTLTQKIEWLLQDVGFIQDKHISKRRFRVAVRDAYKATNYLVQGTAASLLKYAVVQLHKDGVPMVALVHDEIVALVKEEDAEATAKLIEKRLTEHPAFKGIVPLSAEAEIVDRWSDAKILTDENGRDYYFDPEWAKVPRRYVDAQ